MKVSSVLVGREDYPLFQAGKSLSSKVFFILEMKVSSVLVGREVYPQFQAGKSLSSKVFILEMKVFSVSGREDFGHYVLKMSYPLFQAGKVSISC